jgi:hypothetical protein
VAGQVRRRRGSADPQQCSKQQCSKQQWLALCSLLFFCCGAALVLMSDVFEFTWRYQLPALVALPPAGAAALAGIVRLRATGRSGRPEELAQASEQVGLRD